jgi:predicted ester cyclase
MKGWKQAFPDLRIVIDKIVAEGDLVAVRFTAEGTNSGSANGLPATGKRIRIAAMTILRFVDGKAVEEWPTFDQLDLLRQLGLMPALSKAGS